MRRLIPALIAALALTITGLSATPAAAKVPANATTVTNVCLVYMEDGVMSGGVTVLEPASVSYRYIGGTGDAFLWLSDRHRMRVEYLGITPLAPGDVCIA